MQNDFDSIPRNGIYKNIDWSSGKIIREILGETFHLNKKIIPGPGYSSIDTPQDFYLSQSTITVLTILVAWLNHKMYMSKGCKFIIMNKGGRVIQLLGKNHESFDLDLVLVPKTILRTNTNREMLNGYETQNGTKIIKRPSRKNNGFIEMVYRLYRYKYSYS